MSRIEKLSILGVRSFGPVHREAIGFNTPLTLIVGYNGSGKTTIIECLKYATTGELPPNSKGGAFIHDPKLCGEKEVLAQVKLSFRSTTGESYVVTRNLQLTVKKTARSQKTLEGSLLCRSNGERSVTSSKVYDLDSLVPEKLGVSPAILDAVIFCHQDESLWPMSEPSVLKKKFDEIFEAMRYTKAIENLKVLRKRQGEELAKLRIFEEQCRIDKEKGDKAEKRSLRLQAEIEDMRAQCDALTADMNDLQDRIRRKHEEATGFLGLVNELRNKAEQFQYRQDAVAELRASIVDELPESDQELADALARYQERIDRVRAEREQKAEQHRALQADLERARAEHTRQVAELGRHQSDREKHERQLAQRRQLVREAAARHEIRGFEGGDGDGDDDLDEARVRAFHERLQKLLGDKKRELERLQRQHADEVDRATAVITELESRKASRVQDRVFARQRIGANDKRAAALQGEVAALDVDESAEALLQAAMRDLEARLERARADERAAGFDEELRRENERLGQLEAEAERLNGELVECTRRASERAQLDLRQKEQAEKRRRLETLTSTWDDKLRVLLGDDGSGGGDGGDGDGGGGGGDWRPETVEAAFQSVLRRRAEAADEARRRREATQQDLKQAEFRLSSARERLRKLAAEREGSERAVRAALGAVRNDEGASVDEYAEELAALEADVQTCERDISLYDELKKYYSSAEKTATRFNKCRLCERDFRDQPAAKSRLLEKIASHLDDSEKKKLLEEKAEYDRGLAALRAVRPQHDTYRRLGAELPALQEEVRALEAQREALVRRLEDEDAAYREADEKRQDVEAMGKTVATIAQAHRDLVDAERQIERLASQQQQQQQQQQSATSGGGAAAAAAAAAQRGAEEIQERQAACAEQTRQAKARLAKLGADRQRMRDAVGALELERSELKNRIDQALHQLSRRQDLQAQIRALREDSGQQREAVRRADAELEALEPEIAQARARREETALRGRAREQRVAEERDGLARTASELRLVEDEIQDYRERGGAAQLAEARRAIEALAARTAELERAAGELTAQMQRLGQEAESGDRTRRNIADNLHYRKNVRLLEALAREMEALRARNAEDSYERLAGEARGLEAQHNRLLAERGALMGAMKTKDEELARLLAEWELDYKDAGRRYREMHIKVETTKAAIEDLGRYGGALDKAIMQYHALKMEEVNRVAAELWQATYQGTDIDSIRIRSDAETATGRRSYNYRVVMVKQDAEMDMRGRCSAGQRVLASIVIRLALAESFGVHCGLVALDEPTTNLDADNVRALAQSLHAIIRQRQAQSNFQLIVITHDEEFLRHMQCSDFCDTFYRVKRDEKQNSVIVRESITKVME